MKQWALFLLIVLSSCSYPRKLKRAEKKVIKLTQEFPQLLVKDTVRDTVSVIIPEVVHDTSFLDIPGDTVFIDKDKLHIKYVRVGDTVYLEGKCESDTITKTIEIPVERIVVKTPTFMEEIWSFVKHIGIGFLILLLLFLLFRTILRYLKPWK